MNGKRILFLLLAVMVAGATAFLVRGFRAAVLKLQVSRHDLGEAAAQRQLSCFMQLRSLPVEACSAELRRNPNFFPQSAVGG